MNAFLISTSVINLLAISYLFYLFFKNKGFVNTLLSEINDDIEQLDVWHKTMYENLRKDFEDFKVSISEEGLATRKEIHEKIQKNSDEINSVKKKLKI